MLEPSQELGATALYEISRPFRTVHAWNKIFDWTRSQHDSHKIFIVINQRRKVLLLLGSMAQIVLMN